MNRRKFLKRVAGVFGAAAVAPAIAKAAPEPDVFKGDSHNQTSPYRIAADTHFADTVREPRPERVDVLLGAEHPGQGPLEAPVGSLYIRTDTNTLYVQTTPYGHPCWAQVAIVGGDPIL